MHSALQYSKELSGLKLQTTIWVFFASRPMAGGCGYCQCSSSPLCSTPLCNVLIQKHGWCQIWFVSSLVTCCNFGPLHRKKKSHGFKGLEVMVLVLGLPKSHWCDQRQPSRKDRWIKDDRFYWVTECHARHYDQWPKQTFSIRSIGGHKPEDKQIFVGHRNIKTFQSCGSRSLTNMMSWDITCASVLWSSYNLQWDLYLQN